MAEFALVVLTVDTCDLQGSLSLAQLNTGAVKLLAAGQWQRDKSHSEYITEIFSEILEKSKLTSDSLSTILLVNGPGSFTGVRVGFNFCRALAFSLSPSLFCMDALTLQVQPYLQRPGHYFFLKKAFRDLVYMKQIQVGESSQILSQNEPVASTFAEILKLADPLRHTFVVDDIDGTFENRLRSKMPETRYHSMNGSGPSNYKLLALFSSQPQLFSKATWQSLSPLYVRDSEPEEKLRTRL